MTSDNLHTSERLRLAAIEAITELKRPLAAHEIEKWIAVHDPELALELHAKCYDYSRMILSLAPKVILLKFHLIGKLKGIDSRSTFYGIPCDLYDPTMWRQLGSNPVTKRPQRTHRRQRTESQAFAPPLSPPLIGSVQAGMSVLSNDANTDSTPWPVPNCIERGDPFWQMFMEAFPIPPSEISKEIVPRKSPNAGWIARVIREDVSIPGDEGIAKSRGLSTM
jgi:hypothetical protein